MNEEHITALIQEIFEAQGGVFLAARKALDEAFTHGRIAGQKEACPKCRAEGYEEGIKEGRTQGYHASIEAATKALRGLIGRTTSEGPSF